MTKLNQVIAVEKGTKARVIGAVTELYKQAQKPALFDGHTKVYQPLAEGDTDKLPPDNKKVQRNVVQLLTEVGSNLSELIGVTARKDYTNTVAKADVVVDGRTIVFGAPVPFLLFLEKTLTDLRTFVHALPVLDPAEDWTADPNTGLFKTGSVATHRTKKVQRAITLAQATPEHPAQTQLITEDVIAGYWNQIKFSGAIPATEKAVLAARVEKLLNAVKEAREAANNVDVEGGVDPAPKIFEFLLQGDKAS